MAGLLRQLPPEMAHRLALFALSSGVVPARPAVADPVLRTRLFGHDLASPVGLAAGFDKNAVAYRHLYAQGFDFVEVGGVTPWPQPGNPRPRLFRLPEDGAIINRAGFPSDGMQRVASRLARRHPGRMLGINLACNTDTQDPADDFVRLVTTLGPYADFLTLDISCPNTVNGRVFLDPSNLAGLLRRIEAAFHSSRVPKPPLVAKITPDVTTAHLADIVATLVTCGIDGLIVCNTSASRDFDLASRDRAQRGGLSGRPLAARATELVRRVYDLTGGKVPIIGVGGIASGYGAYEKIRAGATAVEVYTALIYEGPALITRIKRELRDLLVADGFSSIRQAVGADHRATPADRSPVVAVSKE